LLCWHCIFICSIFWNMNATARLSKREIGALVRTYRQKVGLKGTELASLAHISQSKISKIETGYAGSLRPDELTRILNILKVPEHILQQVVISLGPAQPPAILPVYQELEGNSMLEARAKKTVRAFGVSLVHVLLQTYRYRQALLTLHDVKDLAGEMKRTMLRQDQLWERGKTFHILLAESVLYTCFSNQEIHLAQLDRISRALDLPTKSQVGIIPLEAGLAPRDLGHFTIYDEHTVLDALQSREIETTDPEIVTTYVQVFDQLESLALYGQAAIDRVERAKSHFR